MGSMVTPLMLGTRSQIAAGWLVSPSVLAGSESATEMTAAVPATGFAIRPDLSILGKGRLVDPATFQEAGPARVECERKLRDKRRTS